MAGICRRHQDGFDAVRFFIAVMGSDAVDDQLGFAVFLGDFRTDRNVSPSSSWSSGLADIVDEPGPFGQVFIDAQFSGHDAGQLRDFDGMAQDILAITGTITQAPEDFDEFRMQTVNARFIRRLFASFADFLIDFFAGLFDHFFNACRMDTAIGNQFFQSNAGDFTAYGIKARQDDRFRRIVDDEIDAGQRFNSPDIASFTADDAAFRLISLAGNDRYCRFGDGSAAQRWMGHGNNFPALPSVSSLAVFRVLDHLRCLCASTSVWTLFRSNSLASSYVKPEIRSSSAIFCS